MRYLFAFVCWAMATVACGQTINITAEKVDINSGLPGDTGIFTPKVTTVPINSLDNDEVFGWAGGASMTGANDLVFEVGGSNQWTISTAGLMPVDDGTSDIGSVTNNVKNLYTTELNLWDGANGDPGTLLLSDDTYTFNGASGPLVDLHARSYLSSGSYTSSAPGYNIAQTWNNGAITFNGSSIAITDTASGANSSFVDYALGGTTKFKVNKFGVIYTGGINGGIVDFTELNVSVANTGIAPVVTLGGTSGQGMSMRSGGKLAWTSDANSSAFASRDTFLSRFAADHIAQFDSTTAQQFSVANTYTSSTNYEMGTLKWTSNVLEMGTIKGSTGNSRNVGFLVGGTREWDMTPAGLFPTADSSEAIGSSTKKVNEIWSYNVNVENATATTYLVWDQDELATGFFELLSGSYHFYDYESAYADLYMENVHAQSSIHTMSLYTGDATTAAATYNVQLSDYLITIDSSANDVQVNLPPAVNSNGRILVIKIKAGGLGVVYLNPNASESIENTTPANYSIGGTEGDAVTIQCDGTEWWITNRLIN